MFTEEVTEGIVLAQRGSFQQGELGRSRRERSRRGDFGY